MEGCGACLLVKLGSFDYHDAQAHNHEIPVHHALDHSDDPVVHGEGAAAAEEGATLGSQVETKVDHS